jgi:hypothetical protein
MRRIAPRTQPKRMGRDFFAEPERELEAGIVVGYRHGDGATVRRSAQYSARRSPPAAGGSAGYLA